MKLTLWSYEGPPHVGAMRVAASLKDIHYVLHAPQGDTYADLLFTMIERRASRPPVSYSTFQARDLGSDTATLFKDTVARAVETFQPKALLVGASCTAELIQDDPGGLAQALNLSIPIVPLELPAYQKKEDWGASETLYQLVRQLAGQVTPEAAAEARAALPGPSCNILGPMSLGFRHRDDLEEVRSLLEALGVRVNAVAPLGADPEVITHLGEAHFNIVLYPELARPAAEWLKRRFGQPMVETVPLGVSATREFIAEVAGCAGVDPAPALALERRLRMPWYSLSVDSNYLTDKRVFIFGDGTHALAAARIAQEEMGFEVVGLGSYSRVMARPLRAAAEALGLEALITDDYLEVEAAIEAAAPELILGTQMERHIAKRLGIGCAVISAPVHVQDFPARYAPQMGYEGANVIFDSWIHPLTMGLEEHLLGMFSEDFEFSNDAAPSHLGHASHLAPVPSPGSSPREGRAALETSPSAVKVAEHSLSWAPQAEAELKKIPFFVRKKARRNTEQFALDHGLGEITVETLYDAKAHFAR